MAAIKYTSIINSFVSPEGSFGAITNYIYYSVLVVYSDGTKEIIEGKSKEIAPLLSFLRTPVDELQEIKQLIASTLSDNNTISHKINQNMSCVGGVSEEKQRKEEEQKRLEEQRKREEQKRLEEQQREEQKRLEDQNSKENAFSLELELKSLKVLLDEGVITQEHYDSKLKEYNDSKRSQN